MNTHKISVKGPRVAAAIVDVIIINIISLFSLTIFMYLTLEILKLDFLPRSLGLAFLLYPLLLTFLYYTLFPYITKGRTISKLLLGIKVVNYEFNRPSFIQLLFRNFFLFLQLFIILITLLIMPNIGNSSSIFSSILTSIFNFLVCLVILIMIMTTDDEQGLHDIIAKTYVVHKSFDIDQYNELNALERRNMDWADFGESTPSSKNGTDPIQNDNDDEIELLKKD